MQYRRITIPPKGRNKYGNYQSTSNITKSIISYSNNGNGTTTDNNITNTGGTGTNNEQQNNYSLRLSKNTFTFEWDDINASDEGQVDTIQVLGFGNLEDVDTFVGDFSILPNGDGTLSDLTEAEADSYIYDMLRANNWGIRGLVDGMSVEVENNGTTNTTIKIKVNKNIKQTAGSLYIPCHIYTGPENEKPKAGDMSDWYDTEKKSLTLEYSYTILLNAVNHYTLDLTNDTAGVNVLYDENGNDYIPSTSIQQLSCKATLYYGQNFVENARYYLDGSFTGLTIDATTGVLNFANNFSFLGSMLKIPVKATIDKFTSTKIMTINKVYPGKDGSSPVNRWIVPNVNKVTYNPNDYTLSTSAITATVMKQVGTEAPEVDTQTPIWWGWDTTNPTKTYSGPITVEAGNSFLTLALRENNKNYESETIPIIKEGVNGESGSSVYTLILSNTNASINCDSDGNILSGAVRPSCVATLYYGTTVVSNATYSIETSATGLTINGNSLVYASNFNFTGDTVQVKFVARVGGNVISSAIMNITKAKAGKDGSNGLDGNDGEPGAPGVGISGTKVEYAISSSQTTTPTSWSTTIPTLQTEKYLWTRTTWTYTDGSTEVGYQKTYIPKNGEKIKKNF